MQGSKMRPHLVLIGMTLALASCERDHPEAFIRPHAGGFDKITIYPDDPVASGYVVAKGIWTLEGDDKIATPINVSSIECYRDEGFCTDYRAYLMTITGTTFLNQERDLYEIRSWDRAQIIAVAEGECRSLELRIDPVAETVMTVTTNNPGQTSCGESTGLLLKPRIARLIGTDEHNKLRSDGF